MKYVSLKIAEFNSMVKIKDLSRILTAGDASNFGEVCKDYGLEEGMLPNISYWRIWDELPDLWNSEWFEPSKKYNKYAQAGVLEVYFNGNVPDPAFEEITTGRNLLQRFGHSTDKKIWLFMHDSGIDFVDQGEPTPVRNTLPVVSVSNIVEIKPEVDIDDRTISLTFNNRTSWEKWSKKITEGFMNKEFKRLENNDTRERI